VSGGNILDAQQTSGAGRHAVAVSELFALLLATLRGAVRARSDLVAENLLLRHQLAVLTRPTRRKPRLRTRDKLLWLLARRLRRDWRRHLVVVTPDTEVLATVAALPRLEPVWRPTYASWLNPIEKRWRWLKGDVLQQHRLAADWPALRRRVRAFLDQFAAGSPAPLRSVGLLADGTLARACHPT
jgi:transposase